MPDPKPIPPEAYDADYFLRECEGHEAFLRTKGRELPARLESALALAGDLAGLRVLDLGCGRGELLRYCVDQGSVAVTGADYASAALGLAVQVLDPGEGLVMRADVERLPFQDASYDLAFSLDLVEHLYPQQLDHMFAETWRVLAPGGRLIVHTMPSIWYYRYGYPLYRFVQRLRGVRLPRDPRDRHRRVHVNEQSVLMLRKSLRRAGFDADVRLSNTHDFADQTPTMRRLSMFLATAYPFKWIFCNDLYAIATKPLN